MTPFEVIMNGLRASLADDEQMAFWEERRKEKEKFRWCKCDFCGTPYRDMPGLSHCPYCKKRR